MGLSEKWGIPILYYGSFIGKMMRHHEHDQTFRNRRGAAKLESQEIMQRRSRTDFQWFCRYLCQPLTLPRHQSVFVIQFGVIFRPTQRLRDAAPWALG